MDLIKKYGKYGLNGLLFIFALVGLIKGCIISGAVLLVLAVLSLPIPQMQTLVEKFLEDSFKQVSEKQPNLTLEHFKKSQKNMPQPLDFYGGTLYNITKLIGVNWAQNDAKWS